MKQNFAKYLVLFYIAIFIAGMANVYAAPSITVTSPNGGEVLSGIETITWNASDSGNSQNLLASIYYSNPAGQKNNLIAKDIDLLTACNFTTGLQPVQLTTCESGLTLTAGTGRSLRGQAAFFEYNNFFYALIPQATFPVASTFRVDGFKWDGVSAWIPDYDINVGLDFNAGSDVSNIGLTVFYLNSDSTLRLLSDNEQGATTDGFNGYKYNGSRWIPDYDINNGLTFSMNQLGYGEINTIHAFLLGKDSLLVKAIGATNPIRSYDWNGAGWSRNDYFSTDYNKIDVSEYTLTALQTTGGLYSLHQNSGAPPYSIVGLIFNQSLGKWIPNSDVNYSDLEINKIASDIPLVSAATFGGINYIFVANGYFNTNGTSDWNCFSFSNTPKVRTAVTSACSFSWDTTTALNGNWFLDINISNGVSQAIDSSANTFQILNYSSSDMNVSCIENCTAAGYDGNGLVVIPSNESNTIVFSATNNAVAKSAVFKLSNSLNDGKRYFVYSSDHDGNYSFDFSLTFGTSTNHFDSIQKIWNGNTKKFDYYFTDSFFANETNYYLLKYQSPAKQWNSIAGSTEWDKKLVPQATDLNDLVVDVYQTSSYSFLQNELIEPIPSANSVPSTNLVFLFTGKAISGSGTIASGIVQNKNDTAAATAGINSFERTYDFQSSSGGILSQKTTANVVSTLQLYDYAIVQLELFLKGVTLTDLQGNELPALIDNNVSWQYLREGQRFKANTTIFDQDGDLKKIETFVYLETVNDANLVSYSVFDYTGATTPGQTHNISLELPGVIDFTAGNKKMVVKIKATNNDGNYSEVVSQWLELVQFPYYPGDFSISGQVLNKKIGENPKIFLQIRDAVPETLRGVRVSFSYNTASPDHSDFNKIYYAGTDFTCNGFDCSFNKTIENWVFPRQGLWNFTATALLTTKNEDWNDSVTTTKQNFYLNFIDFDTLRVFETVERPSHQYRNDEPIQLVLQARAQDYRNLKNEIAPYINLSNCDAATAGNCVEQDLNFGTLSFLYDSKTGYNYWFWRTVFINDNGSLLSDSNFYRVLARIGDKTGKYGISDGLTAVLAPKCAVYDTNNFFSNLLSSLNYYLFGCTTPSSPKVTTIENTGEEIRIDINSTKILTAPTQECFFCLNTDTNNVYRKALEQPITCGAWYKLNEAPIDKFSIMMGNANSDYSKKGSSAQYATFEVPAEIIQYNDLGLMRQSLETQYGTEVDTVGKMIFYNLNNIIVSYANPLVDIPEGLTSSGVITNAGFDCNFSRPIDPTYLNGIVFFQFSGFETYNIQDYVREYPEVSEIEPKDFLEFMAYQGITLERKETRAAVYVNEQQKLLEQTIASPIVINVSKDQIAYRKEQIDSNKSGSQFDSVPVRLDFEAISDLYYNSEIDVIRRHVIFTTTAIFTTNDIFESIDLLISDPIGWGFKNFLWICTGLLLITAISIAWYNFKGGGGTTIINQMPRRRY